MEEKQGILFMCATPIGNLEDITFRAVRVMKEVDIIAAEDTRHTRKLLTHYDIHTELISYHEHNKFSQGPEIIKNLLAGKDVLLVSDAGLPGIADPGSHLVELAIDAGICVTPLPGANAALSGLICSGIDTTTFYFSGFLPKTAKKRRDTLQALVHQRSTLLFYESPHHLKDTIKEFAEVFGESRQITVARELTKKFEEFWRGTIGSIAKKLDTTQPRGEFCLIVAGYDGSEPVLVEEKLEPIELVTKLMNEGLTKKAAIKEAASQLQIQKRSVYQALLEHDNKI